METIYSDGQTLEIERMLKITVFLPQLCYFCGEEITTFESHTAGSLIFHSLDGDHDNWDPKNKVPAHLGCHFRYHGKGKPHPWMKSDGNPMRDPDTAEKCMESRYKNDPIGECYMKMWPTRRERHGPSGYKDPEAFAKARSDYMINGGATKLWDLRRKLYPPNGMKPKGIKKNDKKEDPEGAEVIEC